MPPNVAEIDGFDALSEIGKMFTGADNDTPHERFKQFYIAVEQSPAATVITDVNGCIEFVNRSFLAVTGYTREELIGKTPATIQSGLTNRSTYQQLWQTLRAGHVWKGEMLNRRKSGELYWESETITPVKNEQGVIVNFVAVKEDITQRKRQENELRLLATVFETGQATLITDADMRIEKVNRAFTQITGYEEEEVIGKTPRIFRSGRQDQKFYNRLWQSVLTKGHWQGEIWNLNKQGEVYPLWQSITAVRDELGKVRNFVAVFHNITERKMMETELHRQATLDHLTGVYNRRAFDATLRQAIQQAERGGKPFSILLFDVDRFKSVNDNHGHDVGDAILKQLARHVGLILQP